MSWLFETSEPVVPSVKMSPTQTSSSPVLCVVVDDKLSPKSPDGASDGKGPTDRLGRFLKQLYKLRFGAAVRLLRRAVVSPEAAFVLPQVLAFAFNLENDPRLRRLVCLRDQHSRSLLSISLWVPLLLGFHFLLRALYPSFSFFQAQT